VYLSFPFRILSWLRQRQALSLADDIREERKQAVRLAALLHDADDSTSAANVESPRIVH
jgi:hypothetical protein